MGVFATVILFRYGLQSSSREIQELGAERLKGWLGRLTQNRFSGQLFFDLGVALVALSSLRLLGRWLQPSTDVR